MNNEDLSKQKVVVLGGAGFIGTHVCNTLVGNVKSVVSVDMRTSDALDPRVSQSIGSIADVTFISSIVHGANTVICLSSHSLPGSSNSDLVSEIDGHVAVIVKLAEISAANSVAKFLFASSGGTVYGDLGEEIISEHSRTIPINAYGVSKLAIEHYLRLVAKFSEMKVLSLRIANPYGEGQRSYRSQGFIASTMEKVLAEEVIEVWGDGKVVRDYVYVSDVADAFLKSCTYDGKCSEINIGSGVGQSLNTVLDSIGSLSGMGVKVEYKDNRGVDVPYNVLGIGLAKAELGWSPLISFEEGLKLTHDWWIEIQD